MCPICRAPCKNTQLKELPTPACTDDAMIESGDSTDASEVADIAMESKVRVLIRRLKEVKESDATAK